MSVTFVEDKIGIKLFEKHGGSLILNIKGDTLFNFSGKNNAFLRENFPNLLTVTNFDYKPGFKIINIKTKKEIINFPKLQLYALTIGNHLRIQLKNRNEYLYLSQNGDILDAGTPVVKEELADWTISENCDSNQQHFQLLKRGSQIIEPCGKNTFYSLNQPPMIYKWLRNFAYSYFDLEGNTIIDGGGYKFCKHIRIGKRFFLRSIDGKHFDLLDAKGKVIFSVEGDGEIFFNKFIAYSLNNKNYFICYKKPFFKILDNSGNLLFHKPWFKFSSPPRLVYNNWVYKNDNGNYEILNFKGELVQELENITIYFSRKKLNSPYLLFKKNETRGVYDLNNYTEVLSNFSIIQNLNDRFFLVKTNESKYGVIELSSQ